MGSLSHSCTFIDSLYTCTHPAPAFVAAECAAATEEVCRSPCQGLTHHNGTVRMYALQIVSKVCRYAANPLLMRACASTRDQLMLEPFRGFHSAALIMSELMLLDEESDSAVGSVSCLRRYLDRGPSEVRYAAAKIPLCRGWERRAPFHSSGITMLRRVVLPGELNATVGSAVASADFMGRYSSTIAQIQGSSAWLTPFDRLHTAYVEAESMQSSGTWRDHLDNDDEVKLYAWTKLRGGDGVTVWAVPFDRTSLMCSALDGLSAPPPIQGFQSERKYLDFVYEHIACPVRMDKGHGILLSRGVPHKTAEEVGGVGARTAWRA